MRKIPDNLLETYKQLQREHEIDIYDAQKIIDIADFFLDNELYEYAIDEYLNALLEKQSDKTYIKLGYCYIKLNRHKEAFECYSRCKSDNDTLEFIYQCFLVTYDENSEVALIAKYIEQIEEYISKNQYVEIVETLDFLDKFKLNDYAYYLIGKTCFDYKIYEVAIRCFTKSLEQLELDITYYLRAQAYKEINDIKNALNDVNKILEENPEDLDYLYLKGHIFFSYLEYEQAYEEFKKITDIDETFKDITYTIALCLHKLCKNDEALDFLEKSIYQKKSVEKLYLKSKIYYNELLCDKAFELNNDLLEQSDDIEIILYILNLHLELNKFDEGIQLGLKYQQYSDNIKYNNFMGKFYFNIKQYQKSLEHYKLVLDKEGFHQDRIYFYCGFCCEQTKQLSLAIEYYNKSLELNKDNNSTIERIMMLNDKSTI